LTLYESKLYKITAWKAVDDGEYFSYYVVADDFSEADKIAKATTSFDITKIEQISDACFAKKRSK